MNFNHETHETHEKKKAQFRFQVDDFQEQSEVREVLFRVCLRKESPGRGWISLGWDALKPVRQSRIQINLKPEKSQKKTKTRIVAVLAVVFPTISWGSLLTLKNFVFCANYRAPYGHETSNFTAEDAEKRGEIVRTSAPVAASL